MHSLPQECERIGFVFPHYALGVPNLVRQKLEQIDFSTNKNTYCFAVETYGGFKGNCLAQVRDILAKNVALQYGATLFQIMASTPSAKKNDGGFCNQLGKNFPNRRADETYPFARTRAPTLF